MKAVRARNVELVALLLQKGAKLSAMDKVTSHDIAVLLWRSESSPCFNSLKQARAVCYRKGTQHCTSQ